MSSETLRNMLVKQEPRSVACCYVCAGSRADYPLFSKPYSDRPFFPFLEHHSPPENAENITLDGRVLVCSLCYMLLTQQWESYERGKTPHSKRIYWLKRLDNGPFAGMEVNLQQDYESLFDASHGSIEVDPRQKQRPSRNSHTPTSEIKKVPKFPPRTESRDSSTSSRSEKVEALESSGSNALDLSLPSRTPSRSSSMAMSPASEIESCFVCGSLPHNFLNVYAKPISNCPFFPSLLFHAKPSNARPMDDTGRVRTCENCHKNLLLQWDFYQRQNVPHSERTYNFKLQNTIPTITKQENPIQEKTFVCYTCGMTGQLSMRRELCLYPEKQGEPHFSFLAHISPSSGAQPLVNGKAVVCSLCYKSVYRQLRVYELSGVPEEGRKYKIHNESSSEEFSVLRQHLKGTSRQSVLSKHVCYLCDKVADSSLFVSTIPNNHMYFPFIRTLSRSTNAEPPTADGLVKVCRECQASLKFQWDAFEHAKIPINQRQYRLSDMKRESGKRNIHSQHQSIEHNDIPTPNHSNFSHRKTSQSDTCCLCLRHLTQDTVQVLETLPKHDGMYFPFIHSYLKPEEQSQIDQYGRVPACNTCYLLLKNQWDMFESAAVPHSQRQYRFYMPTADRMPKLEPSDSYPSSAIHVHVPSPDLKLDTTKVIGNPEPLLTTVNTYVMSNAVSSIAPSTASPRMNDMKTTKIQHNMEDVIRPIVGPLDAPLGRPLLVSAVCFLCTEHSSTTPMFPVNSQSVDNSPFFPFLAQRPVPEGAEKLSPDGSALICIFCYHSLMSQYLAYEMSPYSEDANRWQRTYNTYNYVCFVCGTITYRHRICSISVRDFPFLSEHPRPPGALTLLGGECVATCLMCFESLTLQWKEFEHMKVPLMMRKYNWILPSSAKDDKTRGCQILSGQDPTSSGKEDQSERRPSTAEAEEPGLAHGSKPPPHVPVQTIYGSKPSSRAIAASPGVHPSISHASNSSYSSYENNSTSAALSATRTSSFAAALRKLAKQAIDPIAERDSSPAPGQQGMTPKNHVPGPPYGNSHHPVPSSSLLISSVPSNSPYELEKRKAVYGRYPVVSSNSRGAESMSFKEYSKNDEPPSESSLETKRSPRYSTLQQFNPRDEHNNLSQGFQPYWNSEESSVLSQSYDQSSSGSSNSSAYPYHHRPLYPPSSSSQAYRLEESMYFERYGLLRPPAFPPSSTVLPYPGMPFYPNSRYPPGLVAQSPAPTRSAENERLEENFRESDYPRSREKLLESERAMFHARDRSRRDMDIDAASDEKAGRIYSPLSLQINSRTESPTAASGHMESSNYGNSHELLVRKHSPQSSSAPLNLVKHDPAVPSYQEDVSKWKARQQQYTSANQGFASSNSSHPKNGFDGGFEHRFHPPPLISEVNQEMHSVRNPKKPEDLKSRNLSFQPRTTSPYPSREHVKQVPEDPVSSRSMPGSHLNGVVIPEVYDPRSAYSSQYNYREMSNRASVEEWTAAKTHVKNGTVPGHEGWNARGGYSASELYQQQPEISRVSHVPTYGPEDLASHSPHFAAKDASITRALLQNQITPSAIERYVHSSEEPELVSKLDFREEKLRKLRLRTGEPECELSDSESDSEVDLKLKEFLLITKGPPLEMKKLGFFKNVGLTTRPKRQYLEWRKYMKRRERLRDKSGSPIVEDKKELVLYDEDHLVELSKRLCVEDDSDTKRAFLKLFGLEKATDLEIVKSEPSDAVEQTDCQREEVESTSGNHNTETSAYHFKKRLGLQNHLHSNSNDSSSSTNHRYKSEDQNGESTSCLKLSSLESHKIPFSKIVSKAIAAQIPPLIPSEQTSTSAKPMSLLQDPRARYLDRSFAQEFHESVLQATQMQLGQKKLVATSPESEASVQRTTAESMVRPPNDCRLPFSWPGIEAIMESYESHISEQNMEKDFLVDRLQYLQCHNQEINDKILCLGQKTTELVQRKKFLENERVSLQTSLDNLKSIFKYHYR